jgi:hypothetical protein
MSREEGGARPFQGGARPFRARRCEACGKDESGSRWRLAFASRVARGRFKAGREAFSCKVGRGLWEG